MSDKRRRGRARAERVAGDDDDARAVDVEARQLRAGDVNERRRRILVRERQGDPRLQAMHRHARGARSSGALRSE